nr:lmo0937 family membrane protein [Chloroflexota bacterium]
MLEISSLIVVLVVLWLLGFFGPRFLPSIPSGGNLVHVLLVIVVILIVLKLPGFA